ncbi:uncharacterized oxidoreductase YjmC-like isoform X2 [Mytilus trossulus]|uniref:uncharacterized oxidoreductase YjmC-like isoform X1 n=1 Tax=Mytilus trossulus TaxID=6551 RepID=UPI003004F9CB
MSGESEKVVPRQELHTFVVRAMEAVGLQTDRSSVLADLLVSADYRGHYSHGLNRLDMYLNEIKSGTASKENKEPDIVKESAGTALVEGNNLIGPYVARFCMDLAIQKAKTAGIGFVSCRGSNHFGIAGWYSLRAMEQGFLGMAFCNTSPMMVPPRGTTRTLGTNPLSLAAPANNGDSFVLDMATTAVALGKAELKDRKGEPLPSGWTVDKSGHETHDFKNLHGLMPLGGKEESSGYKGYGLAMMVETFCGILSGGAFGPFVRQWKAFERPANLGQCFIAIDPSQFEEGFTDRMQTLIDACRDQPSADKDPVLVPGDPERNHMELCDKLGGIPYHENQITFANEIATTYKLAPMKTL